MKDVVTIGSATKDVFLISQDFKLIKSKEFSTGVGECFAFGAKIEMKDLFTDTGGGATNAAVTCANLGLDVGVITTVGEDSSGQEVVDDLKKRKVDTSLIYKHPELKTGYSTILLSSVGDRTILVYRGAAQSFSDNNLKKLNKLKSKWFYITSLAGNKVFFEKILKISKSNKTKIMWNPGNYEIGWGWEKIKNYLKTIDVLSLNVEEAVSLCGGRTVEENLILLQGVCKNVFITDGKKGAYYANEGGRYFIPSLGTQPLNTTGAGDAFGSAFCAGMVIRNDWKYGVDLAILNSDGVIQEMGAKHGLLTRKPAQKDLDRVRILKIS